MRRIENLQDFGITSRMQSFPQVALFQDFRPNGQAGDGVQANINVAKDRRILSAGEKAGVRTCCDRDWRERRRIAGDRRCFAHAQLPPLYSLIGNSSLMMMMTASFRHLRRLKEQSGRRFKYKK